MIKLTKSNSYQYLTYNNCEYCFLSLSGDTLFLYDETDRYIGKFNNFFDMIKHFINFIHII